MGDKIIKALMTLNIPILELLGVVRDEKNLNIFNNLSLSAQWLDVLSCL